MSHKITIFSTGMSDIYREYKIKPGEKQTVKLVVNKTSLGDLLASLRIGGKIRQVAPPSYPSSQKSSLQINASDVRGSLFKKLSGSRMRIAASGESEIQGRLVGIDSIKTMVGEITISDKRVTIMSDSGEMISRDISDITSYSFLEDRVNSEIKKALDDNFEAIKSGSVYVTLSVESTTKATEENKDQEETFYIQYMVPAAPWKSSYRIVQLPDKTARIDMYAVIDNPEDEDWKDVIVTVVTGKPSSFTTDLAQLISPSRNHISLADDRAVSGFELAALLGGAAPVPQRQANVKAASMRAGAAPKAMFATSNTRSMNYGDSVDMEACSFSQMEFDEAITSEVGDFQIFTSASPVTIDAKTSSLVPMLSKPSSADSILIYNEAQHATRPFQGVRFVNATGSSLSRGSAMIYNELQNIGQGILPDCKPGDAQLIPHGLDTSVSVHRKDLPSSQELLSIRLNSGVGYEERMDIASSEFTITNKKDQEFRFYHDYDKRISSAGVVVELEIADGHHHRHEETTRGDRFVYTLHPKETLKIKIIEKSIRKNSIQYNHSGSIISQINSFSDTIKKFPAFQEILGISSSIDKLNKQKIRLEKENKRDAESQTRKRANQDSFEGQDKVNNSSQIAALELSIEKNLKEIEEINKKVEEYESQIVSKMKEVDKDWQSLAQA